ncbi:MAG: acyltransferase family protein [Candidatus Sulfotelmatobacter sp.]
MSIPATSKTGNDAGAQRERFYRPELDCLRFFAFFAVFIFHTLGGGDAAYFAARGVPFAGLIASAASAGRFGVDLFFFLSAYLITELLLREQEQCRKLDLRFFYMRRILRIWPLYFLGLLIGVLLPLVDSSQHFPPKYALAFVLNVGELASAPFPSRFPDVAPVERQPGGAVLPALAGIPIQRRPTETIALRCRGAVDHSHARAVTPIWRRARPAL